MCGHISDILREILQAKKGPLSLVNSIAKYKAPRKQNSLSNQTA